MDLEHIEQLVALLEERGVREFFFEDKDIKLKLRMGAADAPPAAPMTAAPAPAPAARPVAPAAAEEDNSHLVEVESPMVGTFYAASSPEADPYVTVGQRVEKGQVLCIVEAMKLMNEIEAEVAGTVAEILVNNAEAVQFGQVLFRIEPA